MIVYTSIYGSYDFLHAHPDVEGVEWRCYTDDPHLTRPGWETVLEWPRFEHPRVMAKWRKCHPPQDHDRSVWIDGCVEVTDPSFVLQFRDLCTPEHPIALWRHPQRERITAEARYSAAMQKYLGLNMGGQVASYLARRDDADNLGLYASTIIGRLHTPTVLQMGAAWFAHCDTLTYQDQLSLPVMLADYEVEPAIIPGSILGNVGFKWLWGDHRSFA
jgi:TOD1/MUCI70, glycosyltransferase-like domain